MAANRYARKISVIIFLANAAFAKVLSKLRFWLIASHKIKAHTDITSIQTFAVRVQGFEPWTT